MKSEIKAMNIDAIQTLTLKHKIISNILHNFLLCGNNEKKKKKTEKKPKGREFNY